MNNSHYRNDSVIIIPARIGSTRLLRKPLIMIANKPMILHVIERAMEANICDVYVACDCDEIADVIEKHGYNAVMTDALIPTGSDRVYVAAKDIISRNGKKYEYIINLQGDMPAISPDTIRKIVNVLPMDTRQVFDIVTAITHFSNDTEKQDINNVSAIVAHGNSMVIQEGDIVPALYFSRTEKLFPTSIYKHIGIYAYRIGALERFVLMPQTKLELEEKLEQLRAIEHGIPIGCVMVSDHVISVDTQTDLDMLYQNTHHGDIVNPSN